MSDDNNDINAGGGFGGDGSENDDANPETSVAGLWNFSDMITTEYQLWNDDGTIVIYDYQGDGSGTGQNCFRFIETTFTRDGDEFVIYGATQIVTRTNDALNVDGVDIPLATDVLEVDLNECVI
jgi:hypothetical protein